MRRPLFFIGLSFLFYSSVLFFTKLSIIKIFPFIFTVIFFILLFIRKYKLLSIVSFFLLIYSVIIFISFSKYQFIQAKYNEKTEIVTATVEDVTVRSKTKNIKYTLKVRKIGDERANFKMYMTSKTLDTLNPGDGIEFKGKLLKFDENSEYYKNNFSKGIVFTTYSNHDGVKIIKQNNNLIYFIKNENMKYIRTLKTYLPSNEGAVAIAMFLGDKSGLSENLYSIFQNTGVAHLFSVSGLHLSLISFFIYKIIFLLTKSDKMSCLSSIFSIILFSLMTGAPPSVIRSGIMMTFIFISKLIKKSADMLNSLGAAIVFLLLLRPSMGVNLSLLLSAFSTIGIIAFYPNIKDFFNIKNKALNKITEYLFIWLSANISTVLFSSIVFKKLSLSAPIANFAVLTLAMISLLLTFISYFVYFIKFINVYFPYLLLSIGIINKYIIFILKKLSDLRFSTINISNKEFLFLILIFLIFITINIIAKTKKEKISVCLCVILSFHIISYSLINRDEKIINIPDVKNASLITLSCSGNLYMFGAGGSDFNEKRIFDIINENQVREYKLLFIPRDKKTENEFSTDYKMSFPFKQIKEIDKDFISTEGKLRLSDDMICYYTSSNDNAYMFFDISGVKVLWTFVPGADFNHIKKEYQKADILISRAKPPQNTKLSNFRDIIICDDLERSNQTIVKLNRNMIKTNPNGLKIRINHKNYKIYRK